MTIVDLFAVLFQIDISPSIGFNRNYVFITSMSECYIHSTTVQLNAVRTVLKDKSKRMVLKSFIVLNCTRYEGNLFSCQPEDQCIIKI